MDKGDLTEKGVQTADKVRCACFNLRKAARAVTQDFNRSLRPAGLEATQFSVLSVVQAMETVTVTGLARFMVMDRTTLARSLKPLEREGLISIVRGRDQRRRMISLTRKGEKLLARADRAWEEVQARLVNGMGKERYDRFLTDLEEVVRVSRAG